MKLNLFLLPETYGIYQVSKDNSIPNWIDKNYFNSITHTDEEISIVCKQTKDAIGYQSKFENWRLLKVEGPLDFSQTGVISNISEILNYQNVSVFIISTFNTDYIFIQKEQLEEAVKAFDHHGYFIYDA
ncbi:MAG: ACT domain-containing protein [Bacteroidota bacterium]